MQQVGLLAVLGGLAGAVPPRRQRRGRPHRHAVVLAHAGGGRARLRRCWSWRYAARPPRTLRLTVLGIALGSALSVLASEWAMAAPGADWMLWLGSWPWAPGYVAIVALLPSLLPDGRVPSPRWRLVPVLGVLAVVAGRSAWAADAVRGAGLPGSLAGSTNPVGVDAGRLRGRGSCSALVVTLAAVGASVASIVVRWRRCRRRRAPAAEVAAARRRGHLVLVVLARLPPCRSTRSFAGAGDAAAPAGRRRRGAPLRAVGRRHGDLAVPGLRRAVRRRRARLRDGRRAGRRSSATVPPGRCSLLAVAAVAPLLLPFQSWLQRRVNRWVHGDDREPWTSSPGWASDCLGGGARRAGGARAARRSSAGRRTPCARPAYASAWPTAPCSSTAPNPAGAARRRWCSRWSTAGTRLGALKVARSGGFGGAERTLLDRLAPQAAVAAHTVLLARESRARARAGRAGPGGGAAAAAPRPARRHRSRRSPRWPCRPRPRATSLPTTPRPPARAARPARAAAERRRWPTSAPWCTSCGRRRWTSSASRRRCASSPTGCPRPTRRRGGRRRPRPGCPPQSRWRRTGSPARPSPTPSGTHAPASWSSRVAREDGCLLVEVRDDGAGLREPSGPGVGLTSMRARAEELGGTFSVVSIGDRDHRGGPAAVRRRRRPTGSGSA